MFSLIQVFIKQCATYTLFFIANNKVFNVRLLITKKENSNINFFYKK